MSKYCSSSPWCDEDCCRCEKFAEHEEKELEKKRDFDLFIVGVFLVVLLLLALFLTFYGPDAYRY